jgi:hypothetical protein
VGTQSAFMGTRVAVTSGGVLCVAGCIACIWIFPKFWSYRSVESVHSA